MSKTLAALLLGTLIGATGVCLADANSEYSAGANYAHQLAGQGENALSQVNPGNIIPNYNANPSEKNYYGGVKAGDSTGLKNDGANAWTNTDVGKTVNESVLNNNAEPISPDAPFIKNGLDIQDKAESIVGNTGLGCKAEQITRSEFTNYTCERDVNVEQACTRKAEITGNWTEGWETRFVTISPGSFSFQPSGNNALFSFKAPVTGNVVWATLNVWVDSNRYLWNMPTSFMNTSFNLQHTASIALSAAGMTLSEGQIVSGMAQGTLVNAGNLFNTQFVQEKSSTFTLEMLMNVKTNVFNPTITWTESCPFNKAEGGIIKTECIEAGGNKTVYVGGQPYTLYSACWTYKDTYMTQAADAGSCKAYMENPACTLATRQCAFSLDGICLHENATFSCESKMSGEVMMCGGETFCLDGECDKAQKGTQGNDFQHAVSELAAVAAAGKDVAELNGVDVRAFTGNARFCKKFAVGFSNCCKDSGWGQDLGLANCSSEEKALGKAKENLLTVSIGEFCSKKVLGVCLEKKRSYCQFDSKLAQIVQQQGRSWQLGIGFGGAESPNCRGITVEELQRINFDGLDFSNFYNDLMANQKVPDNAALLERVKKQLSQVNK
ncbi:type-F conjugative transfer system mating-pair stabilization protein TraN [Serratia fonticola]|uniref:type-F conjugative transfer system mating-pair stabilization protein TraN n=1 Tax=Serratia fonticola TaxID=47917 RepID=UPI001376AD6B|nr:type-F conjugative transfer system mating-pair stabilization protein TraN [Serratia fonticola]NCG53656.1 type-F conjugative transfer system mating-pair stabilization protein TraN [Serratia fonticola]